jgi:hypothetical protein
MCVFAHARVCACVRVVCPRGSCVPSVYSTALSVPNSCVTPVYSTARSVVTDMEPPPCPAMRGAAVHDDGDGNHAIEAVVGVHATGIVLKWRGDYRPTLEPHENCVGCLDSVVDFVNRVTEPLSLRVTRGATREKRVPRRTAPAQPAPCGAAVVDGDLDGDYTIQGMWEHGFCVKRAGLHAPELEPPAAWTGRIESVIEFLSEAIRPLGLQVVRSTTRRKRPPLRRALAARTPRDARVGGWPLCTNPAHSFDVRSLKCPRTVDAIIAREKIRSAQRGGLAPPRG